MYDEVMARWPTLKPEWGRKFADYVEEVKAAAARDNQDQLAAVQQQVADLQGALAKTQASLEYERERTDAYAIQNSGLKERIAAAVARADQFETTVKETPFADIEGVMVPAARQDWTRTQYLSALQRINSWLDRIQYPDATPANAQEEQVKAEADLLTEQAKEALERAVEAVEAVEGENVPEADAAPPTGMGGDLPPETV